MNNTTHRGLGRLLRSLTAGAALVGALACIDAGSACAQGAVAQAQSQDAVSISEAGLDLSTDAGARQLLGEIRKASVRVCATQGDDPVYATGGYFGCVHRTEADAVARVAAPRLSALYHGGDGSAVLASNR